MRLFALVRLIVFRILIAVLVALIAALIILILVLVLVVLLVAHGFTSLDEITRIVLPRNKILFIFDYFLY